MITLTNSSPLEATLLSNLFIDRYMPEANGEFVKVYIYLVRTLSDTSVSLSLEQAADRLLCTEKDILRALKYWSKIGVLSLEYDSEKHLQGIRLQTPDSVPENRKASAPDSLPQKEIGTEPHSGEIPKTAPSKAVTTLSPDRIQKLKENEEIIQLLYIAEQYLGKTLTSSEMQKLLYFYDELHMNPELIEYLIEYCVGRNHRSVRYMESIALAWTRDGITTIEEAKASTAQYAKEYFTVLKAMGITGRNPVADEVKMIDTWLKTYAFSMDIIKEACARTILKIGQPSFPYTDKILCGWKEHEIHTLKDIEALDLTFKKTKAEKSTARSEKAASANRFNNFQQRKYDFSAYEKKLLNQ